MNSVVVTLVYKDGTQWIAGGFPSQDAANVWVANEQKQKYWDSATQVQIVQAPQAQNPAAK
jgi:hypothetical protein